MFQTVFVDSKQFIDVGHMCDLSNIFGFLELRMFWFELPRITFLKDCEGRGVYEFRPENVLYHSWILIILPANFSIKCRSEVNSTKIFSIICC
jgi:hypothetical protein